MQRRKFISKSLLGSGLMLSAPWKSYFNAGFAPENMPYATLGRTGVSVSRLGIGCAPLQRSHVSVNDVGNVIHTALEMGVNYFDVAPNYGSAEEKMGPSVKDVRNKMFLVTKTEDPTYEGTWKLLEQSMKRLQTDYLDLVHIHNLGLESRFPNLKLAFSDKGCLGALKDAKEKGVVRFIGASGHLFPSRFHQALDTGEIDVLMNAVNFIVQHTYDFENKVWSRAREENIGLVAMKVLGGQKKGKGYRIPEEHYENAIRYALNLKKVTTAVIGIENLAELQQALQAVRKFSAISAEEKFNIDQAGLELAQEDSWRDAYGKPES